MESYNWGFPFTENFSILRYDITNNSGLYAAEADWDSVFIGMYADLVVRNVNSATETGGDFFNKALMNQFYIRTGYEFGVKERKIPSPGAGVELPLINRIIRADYSYSLYERLGEIYRIAISVSL